jgi:hypothetical protein
MEQSDIIHYNTDEMVCPHCGWFYFDCSDFTEEDGEENCVSCGEKFKYHKNVFTTWDTDVL